MKPRILFFIADSYPTPAEFAAAERIPTEMFRNASQVFPGVKPEPCDGVAGLVPEAYRGFPLISTGAAPEIPAVLDNPPDFLPAAAAQEAASAPDPVAAQRQAEDEGARSATAAQLKAALDQLGIPHPGQLNKAALLALFLGRP